MPISRQRAEPPDIGNRIYHVEQKVEQLERRTLPEQNAPAAAPASIDLFNAIIDPGFPSDPGSHRYEHLTDLLASESWGSDLVFIVGVVNRPGTPVLEPVSGSPTIPGPLALVAFGAQSAAWSLGADGSRARWDVNRTRFIDGGVIWMQGIEAYNGSGTAEFDIFRSTQTVHLHDCIVSGFADDNTRRISVVTDGAILATDTLFQGIVFTGRVNATGCHYTWANENSTATIFAGDVWWDGGTFSGIFGSNTLRLANSSGTDFYIRAAAVVTTQITGSGGGSATIELGAGQGTLDIQAQDSGEPFDLLVDAGMGNAEIRGDYRDITDGGVASGSRRRYDVTCQRTMDITGPAEIRVQLTSTAGRLILRGSNIQCEAHGQLDTAGIFLTLTGCDFGWIVATCSGNGGSSQFYAIDAGSDNSVVVAMGDPASFGSASTNSSGSTIVRDASSL